MTGTSLSLRPNSLDTPAGSKPIIPKVPSPMDCAPMIIAIAAGLPERIASSRNICGLSPNIHFGSYPPIPFIQRHIARGNDIREPIRQHFVVWQFPADNKGHCRVGRFGLIECDFAKTGLRLRRVRRDEPPVLEIARSRRAGRDMHLFVGDLL